MRKLSKNIYDVNCLVMSVKQFRTLLQRACKTEIDVEIFCDEIRIYELCDYETNHIDIFDLREPLTKYLKVTNVIAFTLDTTIANTQTVFLVYQK